MIINSLSIEKIKDIAFEGRKTEKVDVLELKEMCVNFKKIQQKMDLKREYKDINVKAGGERGI